MPKLRSKLDQIGVAYGVTQPLRFRGTFDIEL